MCKEMLAIVVSLALAVFSAAETPAKVNLRVLYIGGLATPRAKAYSGFLKEHFRQIEAVERKGFDPKQAAAFDVVLLDWSQSERPDKPMSPLGPLQTWVKPTVLLGSAGLLLAQAWEIHGTIG